MGDSMLDIKIKNFHMIKKYFLPVFLCITFFTKSMGQYDTTTYYGKMNFIFDNLNRTIIGTGLLREYGIDYLNLENYNGKVLHDSNWVNLDDWRALYATLYSEQVSNNSHLLYLDTINNLLNKFSVLGNPVNFVVSYYNYQGMDTNSITKNLISISNGQLFDVPGRTQSPYITYSMFAVATTQQSLFTGSNQLIFRPELFFGNTGKTISSIQVDPLGSGTYQTATLNTPVIVNYPDTGLYTVNVKISYTDGTINYSHTKLAAYGYLGPPVGFQRNQKNANNGTGPPKSVKHAFIYGTKYAPNLPPFTADKLYLGSAATGDITIDYSKSNSSGTIQKPLILVEGFDPDANNPNYPNSGLTYYSAGGVLDNINYDFNLPNSTTTLNPGLDDVNGYDLIYLHWKNGTDYIERNAYLLEKIISYVNTYKTTYQGVRQQNVIIGLSMGALVVRYALRDMEINGPAHDTRLFISHDGPHWGANVPVGIQALVQDIAPWQIINTGFTHGLFTFYLNYKDMFPDAVNAVGLFNSPAAKQMLIQRYILTNPSNGTLTVDNSTHTNFMNEMNAMGWPLNCTNLTLSNGSCNGSVVFPNNGEMIAISGSTSLGTYFGGLWRSLAFSIAGSIGGLATNGSPQFNGGALAAQFPLSIITTKGSFYLDFGAWAVPTSGTTQIYRGNMYIKRQLFWGAFNSTSYILKCQVNSSTDMLPLDNAPGGTYDMANFGVDVNALNGTIQHYLGGWASLTLPNPKFCFVPTVSSLALPNPQTILFNDVCNIANCSTPTTIKGSFVPTVNEIHTSNTQAEVNWLLLVQSSTANCVKICPTNVSMTGLNPLCTTSTYTLTNPPAGVNYSWSANPLNVVSIVPSGSQASITKQSGAWVTITANLSTCGGTNYEVSKYIHAGGYGSSDYPVTGPSSVCKNNYAYYSTVSNLPGATGYSWFWPSNVTYSGGQNTPNLSLYASSVGGGAVGVRVASTCDAGGSPAIQFLNVNSCGFSVSPNPSTGQVTISMNSLSPIKSGASTESSTTVGNLIYQVKVIDPSGTLKQAANYPSGIANLSLNLGGLPNGIYTIQVFDSFSWSSEQVLLMK
jgi:hypothetical protein